MNTGEINKSLKHVPHFKGTYPCNMIPPPPPFSPSPTRRRHHHHHPDDNDQRAVASYVINTAKLGKRNRPISRNVVAGEHWVALFLNLRNKTGEYFDSFGLPPIQDDVTEFIARHCLHGCTYNTQILQDPTSQACGLYCIDFILFKSGKLTGTSLEAPCEHPASMAAYLTAFHTDLSANDQLVFKRLRNFLRSRNINVDKLFS